MTLVDQLPQPTDLLGPGDVLDISIYEAGVSLFGGSNLRAAATAGVVIDPSSNAERLPPVRVDDYGFIKLPFVGRIRAAGRTVTELESAIQNGLRGMSQDPQVLVSVEQSITESVTLAGEVAKPGRLVLSTNKETLNDAIALSGGYRGAAKDIIAVVERGARVSGSVSVIFSDTLSVTSGLRPVTGLRSSAIPKASWLSELQTKLKTSPSLVEQFLWPKLLPSRAEQILMLEMPPRFSSSVTSLKVARTNSRLSIILTC
jgi:protein involved in polysaccharide export with SLBB domain